jgi:lipoprotein NlpI
MRFSSVFFAAFAAFIVAGAASAATSDIDGCDQSADRERRIASCSRLIDDTARSDTVRAVAHNNRGNALRANGENDRAIADYSEALRLRPDGTYYYNRGNAYRTKGENNRAIADYTEAIKLNPNDSSAYNNRANAYRDEGDFDRAISDLDTVVRDKPTARAFYNRGEAHRLKGDDARAIADYSAAIALDPKRGSFYFDRGRAYLYTGSLAAAQADLTRASELAPKLPYAALWREIGDRRNNSASNLAEATTRLDMNAWPAPIIRLFLGQTTIDAVLADAGKSNVRDKEVHVCEARFYVGELLLIQKTIEQATRMFRSVADECRQTVVEWEAAQAELKTLAAKP